MGVDVESHDSTHVTNLCVSLQKVGVHAKGWTPNAAAVNKVLKRDVLKHVYHSRLCWRIVYISQGNLREHVALVHKISAYSSKPSSDGTKTFACLP